MKNLSLIENKENLGFAEGNNVGIRFALKNAADFILILNNDTLVDKNLIEKLLEIAKKDPKAGILGPKIYFAPGFEFHKNRYKEEDLGRVIWYSGGIIDWHNVLGIHRGVDEVDQAQYDQICETDFVSGCAMFIKRAVFERFGFFDKRYFAYFEDADFCLRTKRAGFKLMFVPQAILWHKVAKSSAIGSSLQDYYITRNRLLFGTSYAPLRAKVALIRESVRILFGQNYWKKKGVIDFYLGRLGKGSYTKIPNF
jgi:GT2 family glycosyltransferase